MKSLFTTLTFLFLLAIPSEIRSQDVTPTEGYVVSLRSLYEAADANSNTVGFLRPGEYVRLEHVHSLVYRVFRDESTDIAGYVVYPKISEDKPRGTTTTSSTPLENSTARSTGSVRKASDTVNKSGSVTNYSTVVRAASYGSTRWVHQTSNIRAGTGTDTPVVAQLPKGTAVKIGTTIGSWASVFRATDEALEPERALGFVHVSLLKANPPVKAPVVAQTSESNVKEEDPKTSSETSDPGSATPILQALSSSAAAVTTTETEIDHSGHDHSEDVIVFVTKTGKKYHLETCRHLRKSKREITLKEAKEKKFEACKTCKPDKKLAEAAQNSQ